MSVKLREATKELNIDNKLALFLLAEFNLPAKSLQSTLNFEQLELLRDFSENNEKYIEQLKKFEKLLQEEREARNQEIKAEEKKIEKEEFEERAQTEEKKAVKPAAVKAEKDKPAPVQKKEMAPIVKQKVAKPSAFEQTRKPITEKEETKLKEKTEEKAKEPEKPSVQPAPVVQQPKAETQQVKVQQKSPVVFRSKEIEKGKVPVVQSPKKEALLHQPHVEKKQPQKKEVLFQPPAEISIAEYSTLKDLSEQFQCRLRDLEEKLECAGIDCYSNDPLNKDELLKIASVCGVKAEVISFEEEVFQADLKKKHARLVPRAPIITVMGHVDHGKTTLLDTLRKTRIAEKEPGMITQKIGAYKLISAEGQFIFIDTPGHEAFVNLRARGSKVTDIVVLLVAANDGVQPQTVEAINHARSANVPIVVAINKIDVAGANIDKVKKDLTKFNVIVEDWGGDVVSVEISAKFNKNLNALLEMLNLVAQMHELKAYNQVAARGIILESRLDSKAGIVATVLLQHGEFRRGDFFICGSSLGKVRAIFNDLGKDIPLATFNYPVEITGFERMPEPGDLFQVFPSQYLERAKIVAEMRRRQEKRLREELSREDKKLTLENLFERINKDQETIFPLVIKVDSFGSLEVLEVLLQSKSKEKLKIEIVHKGIGNISENDVTLASASGAIILGFSVKLPSAVAAFARQEKVEVKVYDVIYHLIEDVELAIKGMIKPEFKLVQIGELEVLQVFKISKVGNVAGCIVRDGKIVRSATVKVIRENNSIFEGTIEQLKRVKDDVNEVRAGTECGVKIKDFNDIQVGDRIAVFEKQIVK